MLKCVWQGICVILTIIECKGLIMAQFMEANLGSIGFPNYKIDTNGNVYSWKCKQGTRIKRWKQLKPWTVKGGYKIIRLIGENTIFKYVHCLVLEIFVGPCPDGMECCHKNNNPCDNNLENLRWDTPKNNCIDRKTNGLHLTKTPRGSKHGMSKLTEKEVLVIRKLVELKLFSQAKIARLFEITPTNVCDIIKRNTWKGI